MIEFTFGPNKQKFLMNFYPKTTFPLSTYDVISLPRKAFVEQVDLRGCAVSGMRILLGSNDILNNETVIFNPKAPRYIMVPNRLVVGFFSGWAKV